MEGSLTVATLKLWQGRKGCKIALSESGLVMKRGLAMLQVLHLGINPLQEFQSLDCPYRHILQVEMKQTFHKLRLAHFTGGVHVQILEKIRHGFHVDRVHQPARYEVLQKYILQLLVGEHAIVILIEIIENVNQGGNGTLEGFLELLFVCLRLFSALLEGVLNQHCCDEIHEADGYKNEHGRKETEELGLHHDQWVVHACY
mmetsp:Transcript_42992/g.80207  ORF Transcript_42992/g.80207 Transcript_42992/m.80207 type:complete len:201 (-) Transcript_42992:375-977(-)